MNLDIVRAVVDIIEKGEKAALVILCETVGATPRKAGAKMLVYEDGSSDGTIGGGAIEHSALQKAASVIRTGQAELYRSNLLDEGMICGGEALLYIERIGQAAPF